MQKTNFPFKLIISNDCSTDNTLEIIKKYKESNPDKIEVIDNKKNLGAMENFINTLSLVKDTEYVALCDGDDFWTDENKLQKQVDFLDSNKDFNICCHLTKAFYQNGEKPEEVIQQGIPDVTTIEDLVCSNYIVANSVVYRWKFNEKSLKDIFPTNIVPGDYYIHLLHAEGGKIKMFKEVMSAYRRHPDGMWWSNDSINKDEFSFKYGRKFLNFYNCADKNIRLPENAFYEQRKDIMYNLIIAYIRNDKIENLSEIIETDTDKKVFEECMKDIVNRNNAYIDYLNEKNQKNRKSIKYKIKRVIKKILRWS